MSKTIQNLINKFGAEKLHQMIDNQVAEDLDRKKLAAILETREGAKQWFEQFAKDRGMTAVEKYNQQEERADPEYNKYGKSCLALNGWNSRGPYVYLWLNRDDAPHFEIGNNIIDMFYTPRKYSAIINDIEKVINARSNETI
jgi:hypothetical protein